MSRFLLPLFIMLPSIAAADVLRVDRATGHVRWENSTDDIIGAIGYEIASPSGSIDPQNWRSITDYGDADSGGATDPVGIWHTYHARETLLAEGGFNSGLLVLPPGEVLDLGVGLWKVGGSEDLVLSYLHYATLDLVSIPTEFFGSPPIELPGDYNASGLVEQADLDLVLGNWGGSAANAPATWANDPPTGNIDQNELDRVLAGWGSSTTTPIATAAVPEPSSVLLLVVALAFLPAIRCKRTSTG